MTSDIDLKVFDCAEKGDLKTVETLLEKGASPNMCLMGSTSKNGELTKERKTIANLALTYGADLLFGFYQDDHRTERKGDSFFTRVKMLKGPGEVKRGTIGNKN